MPDSGTFSNFQNDKSGAIPSYSVPCPYVPLGYQKITAYNANVITAASWSAGQVTFTTTSGHNVAVGTTFTISGMTPAGYNGSFIAITGTTGSTLVAALVNDPTTATGMGTLNASLTAATPLAAPPGALVAFIAISGAGVRYRDDGVAPTASLGYPAASGAYLTYSGPMSQFQIVEQAAGAVLDILYER